MPWCDDILSCSRFWLTGEVKSEWGHCRRRRGRGGGGRGGDSTNLAPQKRASSPKTSGHHPVLHYRQPGAQGLLVRGPLSAGGKW